MYIWNKGMNLVPFGFNLIQAYHYLGRIYH